MLLDESNIQPIELNQDLLESYKDNDDFIYEREPQDLSYWEDLGNWFSDKLERFMRWVFGDYEANRFLVGLLGALPYIFLACILGLIVYLFIRYNPLGRYLKTSEEPTVLMSTEEDIIRHKDIPLLIDNALRDKNYRLAVRYAYLLIIKKLTEADLIDYRFEKTNTDYIKELKNEDVKKGFGQITRLYDFIWYGNFDIVEEDYKKAQSTFDKLNKLL